MGETKSSNLKFVEDDTFFETIKKLRGVGIFNHKNAGCGINSRKNGEF